MKHHLKKNQKDSYTHLLTEISQIYNDLQAKAYSAVNHALISANWSIGKYIVTYEQNGSDRAEYGKVLLRNLSKDLTLRLGKGFSHSNLANMRLFYLRYPIFQTVSGKLSWSHYCEIISIDDELERTFYEKQTIKENWGIRELKRQKESALFLRLAASKDKDGVLALAHGHTVTGPGDIVKDLYVLEFLNIPVPYIVKESELEQRIVDNLEKFLLELGKGFTFVGRQYRIMVNNRSYHCDLVFYHRILRCFVLIDLKVNAVHHNDIGQMNLYMGYFAKEENVEGDNPPIGIILSREKDELLVEYATYGMTNQLFVSKYELYLPNKDELKRLVEDTLNN